MDTITHAISGAVVGLATGRRDVAVLKRRATWGAVFAAFPDSDYAIRLFTDHFTYLNLHRGVTHSVILLPVWAALLGLLAALVLRWRSRTATTALQWREDWQDMSLLAAASLAAHIVGDLITSYGTKVFAPLSDVALAFPITFIIDPWFTGILLLTLLVSMRKRNPFLAKSGLVVLAAYLALQTSMHWRADALAQARARALGEPAAPVVVLPQPLSPFNWTAIVVTPNAYHLGRVNLLGNELTEEDNATFLAKFRAAYRPAETLRWQRYPRWPTEPAHRTFAMQAWQADTFQGFRDFALLPYVTAMRGDERNVCVWFADLRFTLPLIRHPFEYAVCRNPAGGWQLDMDRKRKTS